MNNLLSINELKKLNIKLPDNPTNIQVSRKASLYNSHLMEFGNYIRVDDFAILSGKVILGNFIHVGAFTSLYGSEVGIYIQEFSTISPKASIFSSNDDFSGHALISPIPHRGFCNTVYKKVVLNPHTQICTNAVIMPGVVCGIGSVLGAFSLLKQNMLDFGIYAGIPAKKIAQRARNILELEKQFKQSLQDSLAGGG